MMIFKGLMDNEFSLEAWTIVISCSFVILCFFGLCKGSQATQGGKEPPSVPEWLPGLENAYKYVFHNMDFLKYIKNTLKGKTIVKFRIGPRGVYLITRGKNVQYALRNSGSLSSNELIYMALQQLSGTTKEDVTKFKNDKSGTSHVPSINMPEEERIWAPFHRIFMDNISNSKAVDVMTAKFCELFSETLSQQLQGKWQTIRVYQFLEQQMARCAITSFYGSYILEKFPDLIDAMWKFDSNISALLFSVPRFLYSKPYAARDGFHEIGEKFLNAAWSKFNWNGRDMDADWEPIFGTKFSRTHSKFFQDKGFSMRSRSGLFLGSMWALNSNTIPITGWAIMEIISDKALFQAIRNEASSAFISGELDIKKLVELPLLQSVYYECLRMHAAVNITRVIDEDMSLDGYALKKGYLVQAPSWILHHDESIWGTPDHPATEFWAMRHLKYIDSGNKNTIAQFSLEGRSGGFFPFGGGIGICPGRHFAKQEIMSVIALIVVNFNIELEEYTMMDGSRSDRRPQDNKGYCGTGAMPPDRDMKIRWKRLGGN